MPMVYADGVSVFLLVWLCLGVIYAMLCVVMSNGPAETKTKPIEGIRLQHSGRIFHYNMRTHERRNILCEIVWDGSPVPKPIGLLTQEMIEKIHEHFPSVQVDKYVIMPNHIHLFLSICQGNGTGNPSPTIGNVVAWVKYQITKEANQRYATSGRKVFQRSYHDHVIRDERDYREIWDYIEDNPRKWAEDRYYTQ